MAIVLRNVTLTHWCQTSQNIPDCTVAHIKRNLECVRRSRYLCRRKAFCKAYFWLLQRNENKSEYSYFEKGCRIKCARDNPEK